MEVEVEATYYEIVTYPGGDLCERVGVAGRDEDDVCPAPELDVQYRISDVVVWLRVRRRRREGEEGRRGEYQHRALGRVGGGKTHIPFVVVRPDVHSLLAYVLRLEKRQGRLGRCHLHRYVLVL